MRRISWLSMAAVLMVGFLLGLASSALTAEKHPHMRGAIRLLNQAQQQLERAADDYGGHRARALQLARQAEAEVKEGIAWDDAREGQKPATPPGKPAPKQ